MNFVPAMPDIQLSPAMKWALGVSIIFHMGVIIIGTVGLPYIKKEPPIISQPIALEIINISDETTSNKRPNKLRTPKAEDKPAPKKEKKISAPPKVETKAPPKVAPLETVKPKVETVKPKPKVPPPPSDKLKEPEPKKEEPKEALTEAAAQDEAFLSVLKNLQESEPEADVENAPNNEPAPAQASPLAKFSQQLSASEFDAIKMALNRQFAECWNLMAGARYAEDIVVKIRLVINPDRSVQSARIADQWRYNQDSFYKAAADTALRAVRHPNCQVLDLPPEKYELWKDLIFNFNPSQQL